MKRLFLIFVLIFVGCRDGNPERGDSLETVQSTVRGKVFDFQRNFPVPNFPVKLVRTWRGFCGTMSCIKQEEVKTVFSDQNGNYSIPFDYIVDNSKEDYAYFLRADNDQGNIAEVMNTNAIQPGKSNERDVNAWKPIDIKINMQVSNNNNPPLYISTNRTLESGTFSNTAVSGNGNIEVGLKAKPSASMLVKFYYFQNNIMHVLPKSITTNNNENQTFSFVVDCSQF